MFYLLATILLNTVLFVFFKVFPRYKIDTLQAIVVNYWTCVVTGSVFMGAFPVGVHSIHYAWLPWALLMGGLFISIFNLLGYSTIKDGITTTTIANKLSLVIPVLFSLFLYSEKMTVLKGIGIALAFPAVYLTARVDEKKGTSGTHFWLPVILFLGSGLLDTLVKYTEQRFLNSNADMSVFTVHVFVVAGSIGLIAVAVQTIRGKVQLHYRNLAAGILLGVPNYFSIFYFMKFLNGNYMQSSAAIPVNNIGIVVASALTALFFFNEKLTTYRIVGLLLSIVSILLIALADWHG